jgi:hypothetical protein
MGNKRNPALAPFGAFRAKDSIIGRAIRSRGRAPGGTTMPGATIPNRLLGWRLMGLGGTRSLVGVAAGHMCGPLSFRSSGIRSGAGR